MSSKKKLLEIKKQIQLAYELQAGTYEAYFNNETIEMKNVMINNANVLKKYIIISVMKML